MEDKCEAVEDESPRSQSSAVLQLSREEFQKILANQGICFYKGIIIILNEKLVD
jgi:hypothetical protein